MHIVMHACIHTNIEIDTEQIIIYCLRVMMVGSWSIILTVSILKIEDAECTALFGFFKKKK